MMRKRVFIHPMMNGRIIVHFLMDGLKGEGELCEVGSVFGFQTPAAGYHWETGKCANRYFNNNISTKSDHRHLNPSNDLFYSLTIIYIMNNHTHLHKCNHIKTQKRHLKKQNKNLYTYTFTPLQNLLHQAITPKQSYICGGQEGGCCIRKPCCNSDRSCDGVATWW